MTLAHLARRKLTTFAGTVRACSNWPAVTRAKLYSSARIDVLQFRNGLKLRPMAPLRSTWGEVFEPAIADVYRIRDRPADLIVDVGANIGAFACFAAYTHPRAIVHAFEPSTAHANLLLANVALNCLTNLILHRAPVTRDSRDVVFSEQGTGGASGIILHEEGRAIPMKSVSLDTLDFSGMRSAFIKLDCEGAEGEIIDWICANVSGLPPRIDLACEYHHWCPIRRDRLLEKLHVHGFRAEPRTLFDESYLFATRGEEENERGS
jgi:FkbM family methyltransferase